MLFRIKVKKKKTYFWGGLRC